MHFFVGINNTGLEIKSYAVEGEKIKMLELYGRNLRENTYEIQCI